MKVSVLVASLLLAGSVFGSSLSDKVLDVKNGDAQSYANAAFEIRKEASMMDKEIKKACESFHNVMRTQMSSLSKDEAVKFKDEFHKALANKIASLKGDEKLNFDFGVCKKYMMGGMKHHAMPKQGMCGNMSKNSMHKHHMGKNMDKNCQMVNAKTGKCVNQGKMGAKDKNAQTCGCGMDGAMNGGMKNNMKNNMSGNMQGKNMDRNCPMMDK
ncbi:DUF1104 domain-containing protein [Campylobacter geochelonis]|uniref:Protein of uncharacterized function (DUF1104) n=1 Tax=Campylobacter geochelonis TaxID=1780362 RepID=A0A128EKR3_9BACT|nr:DUF1104 domain-containing protein [Campylobacter geochelonis]QKF71120.1 DUF1104 domain-containing protein [Campylobacter geochelonis]CZE48928.1 Protein of uncharacterised function (DUF1104) [Campylobacter geochelonis]